MDDEFFEYLSEIDGVFSAIRSTLEREMSRTSGRLGPGSRHELEDSYIEFERVRLRFRNLIQAAKRGYFTGDGDFEFLNHELQRAMRRMEEIYELRSVKLRMNSARRSASLFGIHPGLYERDVSVRDALRMLEMSLKEIDRFGGEIYQRSKPIPGFRFDPAPIRKVVPKRQGVGPLQFEITDGKIALQHRPARPLDEDRSNVDSARDSLVDSGSKIIGELERSNCDRRLLESFRDLQNQLERKSDIVKLGLANIGTEMMADTFSQELPDALLSMVRAQNVGIGMYVSQFVDWQRFAEKAESVNLTADSIEAIRDTATSVIKDLTAKPEMADPEVPKTLKALNELIKHPKKASRRAAFAVWRSIENLVIKIFNYGTDFFEKTAEKVVDQGSTAAAAAVAGLMALALAGAAGLSPIASQIPSGSWISKAVEIVKKQIEKIE